MKDDKPKKIIKLGEMSEADREAFYKQAYELRTGKVFEPSSIVKFPTLRLVKNHYDFIGGIPFSRCDN